MYKLKDGIVSFPFYAISFVCALFGAAVFYAYRELWVFFSPFIRFIGGSFGLFVIFLVNLAFISGMMLYKTYLENDVKCKRSVIIPSFISFAITFFSFIAGVLLLVINDLQANLVMLMYLKRDLPYILVFAAFIFLAVTLRKFQGKGRAVVAFVSAFVLFVSLFINMLSVMPHGIPADPCVMDTGSCYSVVFATKQKGTAYIQYRYNNKDYTVYEENQGRIYSDRLIHSIQVPYEHLDNNKYVIGSTKVKADYSYGSVLGKTYERGPIKFTPVKSDKQRYLVVSDWHSFTKDAYNAISYAGDYDGVILMGDVAAGMDFEEEAAKYLVEFGGKLSGGTKPVIFVRGNHDTRGSFAAYLPDYLGYDKFYYTIEQGPYSFVILDSGEDKEDDHIEYGGLDNYAETREKMIDWLSEQTVKSEKVVCFTHAWQISEPEKELSTKAWTRLDELGTDFLICGHLHECRFLDKEHEDEKEYIEKFPGIVGYIDGGHNSGEYVASVITLTPDNVKFEAFDNKGNQVINEIKNWD